MPEHRPVTMTVLIPAALASRLDTAVAAERKITLLGHVSRSSITRLALVEHLEKVLHGATVAR